MKTITVPTAKLIKFIPSPPDGERIPGRVIRVEEPALTRRNDYEFQLAYTAHSAKAVRRAACRLDEDLELVPDSNQCLHRSLHVVHATPSAKTPALIEDGVTFRLQSGRSVAEWTDEECWIPDPFDACGPHILTSFSPCRRVQIAGLISDSWVRLAVIAQTRNRVSRGVLPAPTGVQIGAFCAHNEGWLLPLSSPTTDIRFLWFSFDEIDDLIASAAEPKAICGG